MGDRDGYYMVGADAGIMALVEVGASLFSGYNPEKNTWKVVIGLSNVALAIFIRIKEKGELESDTNVNEDEVIKMPHMSGVPMTNDVLDKQVRFGCMYWIPFCNAYWLFTAWRICKQPHYKKYVDGNKSF